MNNVPEIQGASPAWLKTYYYLRFAFSLIWVVLAFTIARSLPALAAVMLVAYPAWDAFANYLDASRSGGLARNKSQMLNFIVSVVTAVAVASTLTHGMHAVLQIFGMWAVLSGLVTGVRRWKSYGAQWAMILSGAQSGLAGVHMLFKAATAAPVSIADIAPYAAFGAFYFFVSAISLTIGNARRQAEALAI